MILGVGGSGIAGDVVAATAAPFVPVPSSVVKGYELPAYVGEGSLVFAISYSGDTEETVEAATDAAVQGARMVVVSSGGQLSDLAESWGAPLVHVPKTLMQAPLGHWSDGYCSVGRSRRHWSFHRCVTVDRTCG